MSSSGTVDPATSTRIGNGSRPLAARESGRRSSPDSGPRRRLLILVVVIVTFAIWNLQLYQQRRLNADVIGRLEASVHSTTEPPAGSIQFRFGGKILLIECRDEHAGKWVGEEGAAVAIVVDTDDTDSEATACFDDIVVEVENSGFGARTGELLN